MKVTTQKITPGRASAMMARNTGNRPVNTHHVATLSREMKLGRWKLNGDTICLNGDRLIDGQHRLLAVMDSGVTIETLVVEGLPSEVFDTKDIGKRRTAGDTLAVKGEIHCKNLAAALVVIDRYMTGRMDANNRYTNTEIEELLEMYPEVRKSVTVAVRMKKLVPPSIMVGCHYLFSRLDPDAANVFVSELLSGANLTEGDPVYLLRERILQNSLSKAKIKPAYMAAIIIKAWNMRRAGAKVRFLRYREEGKCPEAFPVVT